MCLSSLRTAGPLAALVLCACGEGRLGRGADGALVQLAAGRDQGGSCFVVTAPSAQVGGSAEQPVLVYCPEVGDGRNIGNAIVHLSTLERPSNVHRDDSPYAPAQFNVDLCSYQTGCMGLDQATGGALGSCEQGPVFADLFCHHRVEADIVGGEGVEIVTQCGGATWHHDDDLGLEALPLWEERRLRVTASQSTTWVEITSTVVLDAGCDLWLGNSRRPFGALELTGPGYESICFADAEGAHSVGVPAHGDDGAFWMGEGLLEPPLAGRARGGSDEAADVALCLDRVEHQLDDRPASASFTCYAYAEPVRNPGRVGLSCTLAPWDDWPLWPAARYAWSVQGRLVAGPPEAGWEQLCGLPLASCGS